MTARSVLVAALAWLVGCPSTPCVPADNGGRCIELVCPKTSHADDRTKTCVCDDGSSLLVGACVPYALADGFCGHAAKPFAGGCNRTKCKVGEALDLASGLCLPASRGRALLGHRDDQEDERRPTCLFGSLVHRNGLACAVGPLSCARGERYVKAHADAGAPDLAGTCDATPACGAGEVFDDATSRCVRVMRQNTVDVGTWSRVALGTDGAEGSNAFCAPIRAVLAHSRFQLQLTFPDNDITQVTAQVTPVPPSASASDAAERSVQQLIEALRFLGGTATAASVSLELVCTASEPVSPSLESPKTEADAGR
jgi:hypothetical protein